LIFPEKLSASVCDPAGSSDESAIVSSSFLLSILIALVGIGLSSIDAFAISISSALSVSSRTGLRTSSFTVSVPVNVNLSMLGTIRME